VVAKLLYKPAAHWQVKEPLYAASSVHAEAPPAQGGKNL
jgi:hypothetical protein